MKALDPFHNGTGTGPGGGIAGDRIALRHDIHGAAAAGLRAAARIVAGRPAAGSAPCIPGGVWASHGASAALLQGKTQSKLGHPVEMAVMDGTKLHCTYKARLTAAWSRVSLLGQRTLDAAGLRMSLRVTCEVPDAAELFRHATTFCFVACCRARRPWGAYGSCCSGCCRAA